MPEIPRTKEEKLQVIDRYLSDWPVPVEDIARDLGLRVYRMALGEGISGKVGADPTAVSGYAIHVDSADNPRRQRFTLAHEIAHYILHCDRLDGEIVDNEMYKSATLSHVEEREANRMAADILLPVGTIRHLQAMGFENAPELARKLDVSELAMRVRLSYMPSARPYSTRTTVEA